MKVNNIRKRIIYNIFFPFLFFLIGIVVSILFLILFAFMIFPPVGGLKRAVEKMEVVASVESVSQVLYEHKKNAEMTILLKNGLKIKCYGIQHGYETKLLFSSAKIVGYTGYRCSYNTNNTIRNIYNVEEYNFRREPVYLDDLLDVVLSLEESVGGSQFFITDESFLENTWEEMYRLLPGSPWDYSEDGVFYKFFFVRE